MTDKEIIFKLLDNLEGIFRNDPDALSNDDLSDYCTCAIAMHKKYGRSSMVHEVVSRLEGLGIGTLVDAGLTYEDYKAAI